MPEPLHFSKLKRMAQSPAHYRAAHQDETRPTGFGTLVHALVLGGEVVTYDGDRKGSGWSAFKAIVAARPHMVYDGARTGKAWRAAKDEAIARGIGTIVTSDDVARAATGAAIQAERARTGRYLSPIVTTKERTRAEECAAAVLADPRAAEMLTGAKEVPLTWRIGERECAGQIDVLAPVRITDLKSSALTEPSWFIRQALRMLYHAQLAFYAEGARQNGYDPRELCIVAVEPKPPFAVTTFRLTDRCIEEGERLIRMWLERLKVCEDFDVWPAYCEATVDLDTEREIDLVFPGDDEDEQEEAA